VSSIAVAHAMPGSRRRNPLEWLQKSLRPSWAVSQRFKSPAVLPPEASVGETLNKAKHHATKHTDHPLAPRLRAWSTARQTLIFAVISIFWILFLYRGAIHAPFVYDDIDQIQKNAALLQLRTTFQYFHSAVLFTDNLRGFGGSFYRPFFWLSLAVDQKIWGLNPTGFHITNIVLHWIAGLLGFFLLRRLRASILVSAMSSLLWLGLPINSEVVAWVSGRSYSLMAIFLFLALLSSHWYVCSRKHLAWFLYSLAALAAILCHEEGILVLPMTLLVLYVVDRFRPRREYMALGAAGISILVVYFCLREIAGTQTSTAGSPKLLAVGVSFMKYLSWMILPTRMSVERSTDVPANNLSIVTASAWIGVVLLFLLVYRLHKRMPELAGGIAWTCIALVPFCGIVYIYQGMAERFNYLASGGLCFSIAALLSKLRTRRSLAVCAVAMWAAWGIWRLEKRVLDWRDSISLYEASLEATPQSATLLFDLGAVLEQKGDFMQAAAYYEHTLDRNPDYERAITGLGNVDLRLGATGEAKSTYERALALNPDDATALVNYGATLQQLGDFADAKQQEEKAISINPTDVDAYINLGVDLFQLGSVDAAVENLLHAIELEPSRTPAYFDLAALYKEMGHIDSAAAMYRKILEVSPNDQEAISQLREITQ
jgi:protein O-mannosyl-transferase